MINLKYERLDTTTNTHIFKVVPPGVGVLSGELSLPNKDGEVKINSDFPWPVEFVHSGPEERKLTFTKVGTADTVVLRIHGYTYECRTDNDSAVFLRVVGLVPN